MIILADFSEGYRNRNPTKGKVQYMYPYYGMDNHANKLCVTKKWWKHHPLGKCNESGLTSSKSNNHFKKLLNKEEIYLNMFKCLENHIWTLYNQHVYKHGGKAFPFFNYNNKKFASKHLKEIARSQLNIP